MKQCTRCGKEIDTTNPRLLYFTVKLGSYLCNDCHNSLDVYNQEERADGFFQHIGRWLHVS